MFVHYCAKMVTYNPFCHYTSLSVSSLMSAEYVPQHAINYLLNLVGLP